MTFSQYAGTSLVPTLARLVLAAVFIPAGWNKVFKDADFTAEQANRLRNLGVNVEPATPPKVVASDGWKAGSVQLASYRVQDAPPSDSATGSLRDPKPPEGDAQTQPSTPPEATTPPQAPPADQGTATTPPNPTGPLPEGTYRAQGLHQVTLMLSENHFPYPVWQARLAAFTELVGGSMLLLGLFSRIWGLGLSIAMGVAFYLVSMKMNSVFTMDPRTFAEVQHGAAFSTAALQLSLFVLAFGVLLTGPGPLSLDRMLFGGGREELAPGEVKLD